MKIITSECVSKGHPDKIADILSDSILDLFLKNDRSSKVACEVMVANHNVIIAGEISSQFSPTDDLLKTLVIDTVKKIGYTKESGYNADNLNINILLNKQSNDIAMGVNLNNDFGAGDQGLMFGYATNETKDYLPITLSLSRYILNYIDKNKDKAKDFLLFPDAKSQVFLDSTTNTIKDIIVSHQHSECDIEIIRKNLKELTIEAVMNFNKENNLFLNIQNTNFHINKTGKFTIGGPVADCGLTGRKIVVDAFGGGIPVGGGAFSGKDPTKVDRSAAYMCRYLAKKVVANKFADKCLLNVAYCIGYPFPISYSIETFGTRNKDFKTDEEILNLVIANKEMLTPKNIINFLELTDSAKIKYANTAMYGHFGDFEYSWENI